MKKMFLLLCCLQLLIVSIHAVDEMHITSSNGFIRFYAERSSMNHYELSIYFLEQKTPGLFKPGDECESLRLDVSKS